VIKSKLVNDLYVSALAALKKTNSNMHQANANRK
jgi:hypothetical protein